MEEKRSVLIVVAFLVCGVMSAYCIRAEQCGTQASGATCGDNNCCSKYGWCGSSDAYCGDGCQSGPCSINNMKGSSGDAENEQCGTQAGGATCGDNNCCSKYGWCGSSDQYCGDGCQSGPCSINNMKGSSGDAENEQCGTQAGGATCANNNCCSKYGWCGSSDQYCGDGCQSGPCTINNGSAVDARGAGNTGGDVVGSIISDFAFDQFLPRRTSSTCPANGFYTRSAFLLAASAFPGFGTTGDATMKKRELAAFFANIAHKSGSGCYKEKVAKGLYCDPNLAACAPEQHYYGRGPFQITWNNNYWMAGNALGFDGVNNPNIVASDPVVSFKTALWYWMTQRSPTCHASIVNGQGFAATIDTINGPLEGGFGGNQAHQKVQMNLYKIFCSVLNVDPGIVDPGNNLKMVI